MAEPNIVEGVSSDIEQLMSCFSQTNSVRYAEFNKIWKDMKFPMIFSGRQNDRECREFTEELFKIALNYFMPPYGLQVRVGGLYLLYGLYFKQLFEPKVKIRMTIEQWKQTMLFLMEDIRPQCHWDVEFIFHKLRFCHAFQFVAMPTELYPSMRNLPSEENTTNSKKETDILEQPSVISNVLHPDQIDQLSAVHDQYYRMKCALGNTQDSGPPPSLNVTREQLIQHLTKTVASFEEWRKTKAGKKSVRRRQDSLDTTESEGDSEADSVVLQKSPKRVTETIGQKRAELKALAFSGSIPSYRSCQENKNSNIFQSNKNSNSFQLNKKHKEVNELSRKKLCDDTDDTVDEASINCAISSDIADSVSTNIRTERKHRILSKDAEKSPLLNKTVAQNKKVIRKNKTKDMASVTHDYDIEEDVWNAESTFVENNSLQEENMEFLPACNVLEQSESMKSAMRQTSIIGRTGTANNSIRKTKSCKKKGPNKTMKAKTKCLQSELPFKNTTEGLQFLERNVCVEEKDEVNVKRKRGRPRKL